MKEISRKSMYHEENGIACGPVSVTAIDAEIVVDDKDKNVYLHAQWVDEASSYLLLEVTRESTYDIYEKLNDADGDEFNKLIAERDRICKDQIKDNSQYALYFEELKKMIMKEMEIHNIECDLENVTTI